MRRLLAPMLLGVFMIFLRPLPIQASEPEISPIDGIWESEQDWPELDLFLQKETGQTGADLTFSGLMKMLMEGNGQEAVQLLFSVLKNNLLTEVSHGRQIAGQLLALGLIGAVFANFSNIFTDSQISETGFFMSYLLTFVILATGFSENVLIVQNVLEKQVRFFQALIPSFFLTVAWAGGSLSSVAWYEVVLFLIAVIQWLYLKLLLPVAKIYIMLVMAGHMTKEDMLSRLTDLIKTGVTWGTRSLIGLVLGFQVVQGLVLPYADAMKSTGVTKLLQIIPGIGQGAGAVTKMLLGSGVLIKNTMGAAAVLLLLVISLVPVLKLLLLLCLYRLVAAVMQPVCDKRLVACISSVADGQKMLLELVISTLLLFVITIALICGSTNVSYLA